MSDRKQPEEFAGPSEPWPVTWEANRMAQLDAALSATPAQRLAWLEEAILFVHRVQAPDARSAQRTSTTDSD